MAPNANHSSSLPNDSIPNTSFPSNELLVVRNIAHGVNYSIPSNYTIEWSSQGKSDCVESCKFNTGDENKPQAERNVRLQDEAPISVRKSQRQPKPHPQFPRGSCDEKSKVRYDANLVPLVRKNPAFVEYWRQRDTIAHASSEGIRGHGKKFKRREIDNQENSQQSPCKLHPFAGDETVLWIPSSRVEWEDCISEMTAICKSAALRRHSASANKPFYAPLSRDYIRDRVDIDDPLLGYQLRHKTGGWMQGFIMFTNFTHWSHYFKWDSMHEASGVQTAVNSSLKADTNGGLSTELEAQERSGDPLAGGVVFPTIAEIGLVGALGCGEYLLRMALDDIRTRERYKYVVLQSTDASRTFYEKFGFVRVGAISRYGPRVKGKRFVDPQADLSDVVGYRHWTYAHESEKSLGKHGGPSYMMALRVDRPTAEQTKRQADSYLETMKNYAVSEKPKVKQLGASSTPVTKKNLLNFSTMPGIASVPDLSSMDCVPHSARKALVGKRPSTSSLPTQPSICADSSRDEDMIDTPVTKKQRTSSSKSSYQFMQQREELLSPPPPGASLSYQQKQYQSVWLAVPPKMENFSRRPPRERPPIDSIPKRRYANKKVQQGSSPGPVSGLKSRGAAVKTIHKKATASKKYTTVQTVTPSVLEATGAQPLTGNDENKENVSSLLLKKQKAPSQSRHLPKQHNFFNKVVKLKATKDASYFFSLHFDMEKMVLEVLPMTYSGVLGGKRSGRPKWKVQVNSRSTVLDADKCEIVPSDMVSKTPFVANESWDIL